MQVFEELSVWDQLGDRNAKTTFTNLNGAFPTTVSSLLGGSWVQMRVGLTGQVTRSLSMFASADGNVAIDHSGYAIGGHIGAKFAW